MPTIRVQNRQMSTVIKSDARLNRTAMGNAIEKASERFIKYLRRVSPRGATDEYRNSWETEGKGLGLRVINSAPYAGIIERGARPHPVNQKGIEKLILWARAKITNNQMEAEEIAHRIAWSIRQNGSRAFHVLEKALPRLEELFDEIVEREIESTRRRRR